MSNLLEAFEQELLQTLGSNNVILIYLWLLP